MIVPEVIIYHSVKSILAFIKKDYEDDTTTGKTENILHKILYKDDNGITLSLNNFDYLKQGVNLFVNNQNNTHARKIDVNVGYNTQRAGIPTIHILLPNESKHDIGIGMGEGYQGYELITTTIEGEDDEEDVEVTTRRNKYTGVYKSNYNLIITSDNSSEAVLIYHVLKNLMFACFPAFELRGLRDVEFGGQDLQFTNEFIPPEVFHRSLTINFFYESTVPSLVVDDLITGIATQQTIMENS